MTGNSTGRVSGRVKRTSKQKRWRRGGQVNASIYAADCVYMARTTFDRLLQYSRQDDKLKTLKHTVQKSWSVEKVNVLTLGNGHAA